MLNDFFIRAMMAGVGVALVVGPLGCFVVWRRMAYFGATMSHGALLGVAGAVYAGLDPQIGVLVMGLLVAPALLLLERFAKLATDTLLGILAHATLALGLVLVAFMTWIRIDLMSYLFGDILAVSERDIAVIFGAGAVVLGVLVWLWRPLLASTVSEEIAAAEQMRPQLMRLIFMLLIAMVIAMSMKIVGILLIVSMFVLPPAIARAYANSPERMALFAALAGVLSVVGGLYGSLKLDLPSGPAIVVTAFVLFLASLLPIGPLWSRWRARDGK